MRTRKSADARKDEIIDATLELADKLGPDSLTTGRIADAVGLTQPGIFRHFPTKQDLWEAVAARIGSVMTARWDKAQRTKTDSLGRIRRLIIGQLRLIQSTPAIPAILFSRELHAQNGNLRRAFSALLNRFHQTIRSAVESAAAEGELRTDVDPDDAAFLIIGLVQGLAMRWSITGRTFDLAHEGERLLDIQLSGLTPGGMPENKETDK